MSEMVERVAKAILEDRKNSSNMFIPSTELCLAMARAAIAAMREPTPSMVAAGWRAHKECPDKDSDIMEPIFEAMIDASLV